MRKMTRNVRRATLSVSVLALVCLGTVATAQEPAPAAGGGQSATAVVGFFEELARIATDNRANCANMGQALNDYLDQNQQLLRDAAYSSDQATAEQEAAVTGAATTLGVSAGACYEEATVATFFDRFATLTADLE